MPSRISFRPARPASKRTLSVTQALALGALHGPAELLPVSSSGHVSVLPWLWGWSHAELGDETQKSFEVFLHAGSAAAWLLSPESSSSREVLWPPDARALLWLGLAVGPAGAAGLVGERAIERRLGTPALIATGLALGALVMIAADRAPERRGIEDAGLADAAWLGLAQAGALLPGISRTGATLAVARLRRFRALAAWRLSAGVAGPVIAGAAALKLGRLASRPSTSGQGAGMVAGAGASFLSTLLAARLLRPLEQGWPLRGFAAYRLALAAAVALRLRRPGPGSTAHRCRGAGA